MKYNDTNILVVCLQYDEYILRCVVIKADALPNTTKWRTGTGEPGSQSSISFNFLICKVRQQYRSSPFQRSDHESWIMITLMKKNTLKCVGCFDTSDSLPVIIPLSDGAFTECFLPWHPNPARWGGHRPGVVGARPTKTLWRITLADGIEFKQGSWTPLTTPVGKENTLLRNSGHRAFWHKGTSICIPDSPIRW